MQSHQPFRGITFCSLVALSGVFAAVALAAEPMRGGSPHNMLVSTESNAPRMLSLMVDFASILHIDGEMSAIAVGNPEIADASLADQRTVILTGRTAGITNLIALNDAGDVLANVTVRVTSQKPSGVVVRRGTQLQTDSCNSPSCDKL